MNDRTDYRQTVVFFDLFAYFTSNVNRDVTGESP